MTNDQLLAVAEAIYRRWFTDCVSSSAGHRESWDELAPRVRAQWVLVAQAAVEATQKVPVPLRLTCPRCSELHVDEGEFATKPHHTHACQECGEVWRPAIVPTVGVRFLPGFRNPRQAEDPKQGEDPLVAATRDLLAQWSGPPAVTTSTHRCLAWSYEGAATWVYSSQPLRRDGRQCALDAGHSGDHELVGPHSQARSG